MTDRVARLAKLADLHDELAAFRYPPPYWDSHAAELKALRNKAEKNCRSCQQAALRIMGIVEDEPEDEPDNFLITMENDYLTLAYTFHDLLVQKKLDGETCNVFCLKIKADYKRYQAEFTEGDTKSQAVENARAAYAEATAAAEKDLIVTHSIRLDLALNCSVFQYDVLANQDEAYKMARKALEDAQAHAVHVASHRLPETTFKMQLLSDNLAVWASRPGGWRHAKMWNTMKTTT